MHFLRLLADDRRGVTALEYALIALLVAIVLIGGASTLGSSVGGYYSALASSASRAL